MKQPKAMTERQALRQQTSEPRSLPRHMPRTEAKRAAVVDREQRHEQAKAKRKDQHHG